MDQTITSLKNGYNKTIALNNGVSYYDRLSARYKANPAAYQDDLNRSEAKGKLKAFEFLRVMENPLNPDRLAAVETFNKVYNADETEVRLAFVAAQYKVDKIQPFEYRSEGTYESRFFRNVALRNADDTKIYNDCKDVFQKKWAAEGYNGDKAVMDLFKKENPEIPFSVGSQIRK